MAVERIERQERFLMIPLQCMNLLTLHAFVRNKKCRFHLFIASSFISRAAMLISCNFGILEPEANM